jgi:hypothetical protein
MGVQRIITCDRESCTSHFFAGTVPEWLGRQDAAREGWKQIEIVSAQGSMKRVDLCPTCDVRCSDVTP